MASRFFKHLYFLRFSIAGWIFLPILCGLDWANKTSSITRAILTLDSGWQVYHATFFVVALGMTVLITARNTVRNGVLRFCDAEELEADGLYTLLTDVRESSLWKTLGIAHIPTLITFAYLAYISRHEQETFVVIGQNGHWFNFFVFMLAGLVGAVAFWYVVSMFYYWTYRPAAPGTPPSALLFPHRLFGTIGAVSPPPRLTTFIGWITGNFLNWFSAEGYSNGAGQPVWELHFLSTVSLVGIFLVYAFLFPLTAPVLNGNKALVAEIVACLLVTGGFIYSIANAGFDSPAPGSVFCTWAPPVKRGFIALALGSAATFLVAVGYDHCHKTVRLAMAFPSLGSILVLSIFFLWLFAGAAFFFDRYRIPVFTAVLLAIFLPKLTAPYVADCLVKHNHPWLAEIFDSDHFFTVKQLPGPLEMEKQILDPAGVLAARVSKPDEPYIIVTAAGGGIRAAEWTAQVLAQLEQTFAADGGLKTRDYTFHDHLLMASGVSGGSVGLMPYLLEYTGHPAGQLDKTAFPTPAEKEDRKALADRITRPSACSGLEAVGWGLTYRDLVGLFAPLRLPPFPRLDGLTNPDDTWTQAALASDTQPDRSWALAEAFNRNLNDVHCGTFPKSGESNPFANLPIIDDGNALTLARAARMLHDRQMPAFTFNTTAEETGSRFLLSNYAVPTPPEPTFGTANDFVPAESFLQAYAMHHANTPLYADLPLSTAARLSATFPLVSSGTRIPPAYVPHAYHFLDGGYFDNDGTASAIEFLKSALDTAERNARNPKAVQPKVGIPTKKLKIILIEIRDDDGTEVTKDMDTLEAQNGKASNWTPLTQLTGLVGGLWNAGHSSISRRNRRELCIEESRYSDRLDLRHIVFTIPDDPEKISPLNWKLTGRQSTFIDDRAKGKRYTDGRANGNPDTTEALKTTIANIRDLMSIPRPASDKTVYPCHCETWSEKDTSNETHRQVP